MDWIEEHSRNFWVAVIGLVAAAFAWFVRTFLTNQTQIAILNKDLNDIKTDIAKIEAKNNLHIENQREIMGFLREILKAENAKSD